MGSSGNQAEPAEWSLQWLWNQPEVSLVISGMSTLEQVQENLASASRSGIGTLSESELKLVDHVHKAYHGDGADSLYPLWLLSALPGRCGYPSDTAHLQRWIMYDKKEISKNDYSLWVPDKNKGSLCVVCRECEEKCPQDIPISDWMSSIHQEFTETQS